MTDDATWMRYAVCASIGSELFFPEGQGDTRIKVARRICRSCPVQTECLDWALSHGEYGIWAGTTERQRGRMRRHASEKAAA